MKWELFYRKDETKEAFDLMQDVNPSLPAEYILKGIVYALIGQETNNVRADIKFYLSV